MASEQVMNDDEQVKKLFETGKALRERQLYRAACTEFQKAVEIGPASADLLVEWGRSLSGKGDVAGAIEKYRKASELDAKRGDAYVLWGEALRALGKFEEAVERYAKAIEVDPQNLDAYSGWADALYAQEKWKEAIELYEKVIEGDPARYVYDNLTTALEKLGADEKAKTAKELEDRLTRDSRYAIALALWADELAVEEKYDEAVEQYRNASQVDPDLVRAYDGWGDALQLQKKYAEAVGLYLKAIERDPGLYWLIAKVNNAIANLNGEESAAATKRLDDVLRSDAKYATLYREWGDDLANRAYYPEAIKRYQDALELDPKQVDAFLGWGDALAAQAQYDGAIDRYRQATLIDPGAAKAYCKWGGALSSKGQHAEAAEQYQRAIAIDLAAVDFSELLELLGSLDSGEKTQTLKVLEDALALHASPKRYVQWGDALSREKRYAEALTQYEKAVQQDEKASDAWEKMGEAQVSLGDYSKAIESYRRLIELDPYDGQTYILWGNALFEQRRYAEAAEIYDKASELTPHPEVAHFNGGLALFSQRRHAEAIERFKKALEFNPDYGEAHHHWGIALAAQRRYDEAIEHYGKALAVAPDNANPYLDWGNALDEQGRHAEAIKVCEQATKISEDFAYAYHNIAYYLWAQGDYKAGRKAWEKACQVYERSRQAEKTKGNATFFQYYGSVLDEHLGKPEKSERMLQEGLAIDPNHTGILGNLLSLYLDRHDEPSDGAAADAERPLTYGKARECFRKAERILKERLEIYEDSWTLQELGDLYLKMGEYDDARSCLEKALDKDSASPAPYVSLGVVRSRKEDFRQSAQYFEEARRRNRNDLNLWSNLAEVYLKRNQKDLKQIEKAEAEFRKILKIAPDHIDSRIGLGEVYTAMAEAGEKDFYEVAIKHYGEAIRLAENGQGSKRLKTRELAGVRYSLGYARVKFYEASRPFGEESLLSDALQDFCRCAALDPDHYKAERAKDKLDKLLSKYSRRWFAERSAPWLVLGPSLFVLCITQLTFIFGVPKPIDVTAYIALTFGSLIFVVVGLFLPEIQKLKGAGIELEKGAVTQISTSGSIGISK